MVALCVAATLITLWEFARLRERRLLPLAALFVFLALAHSREEWSAWKKRYHVMALGSGLVLMAMLSRPAARP